LPRLPNVDVLRAMGVRFAVTDLALPSPANLTRTVALKEGIDLHLYELPHPNIVGFAPVTVSGEISPTELLQRIRANPPLFESEAFADSAAGTQQLLPVQRSQLIFERGGVHVTATSNFRAASAGPIFPLLPAFPRAHRRYKTAARESYSHAHPFYRRAG